MARPRALSAIFLALLLLVSIPMAEIGPSGAAPIAASPSVRPPRSGPDSHSVARLYQAYFQRDPDPGGLSFWTEQHSGGRSLGAISQMFATSPEFKQRYGGISDAAFVDLVYRNVLGRPADRTGRDHWVRVLSEGRSRGSVMLGFSDSAEFKVRSGIYNPGHRVLLIGDSLMHEAGPYAVGRLRDLGFEVHLHAHPGSGLLASAVPMDWLAMMTELVDRIDPDLVVVEFCCNHWPSHQPDDHPFRHVESKTPEFRRAWSAAVGESIRTLTSRGASMAWVVTPPVRDENLQRLVSQINDVAYELTEIYGLDRIDWAQALAPSGSYQDRIGDELIRHPDGLHLASAGARRAGLTTAAWVTLAAVNER